MAQSGTATAHDVHEHHDLGFVRTYIFSTDHKMIARQFLFLGLFMLLIGGFLAMLIRWQLGFPGDRGARPSAAGSSPRPRGSSRPRSTTCCSRCTPPS